MNFETAVENVRAMIVARDSYIEKNTREDGDWDGDIAETIASYNDHIAELAEQLLVVIDSQAK